MKNFEDYTITVAMFEGFPVEHTVTAEDQREMDAAGFSASEIYDFHSTYQDWQADC